MGRTLNAHAMIFCALVSWGTARAQVPPPSVLVLDFENTVRYYEDVSDPSRFATVPGPVPAASPKNFSAAVQFGDIVSVNGQPVKGTNTDYQRFLGLTPTPNSGDAIADAVRIGIINRTFDILKQDGTLIGTLICSGLTGGLAPPGAPSPITQGSQTVTGGTGAFLGARGECGVGTPPNPVATRLASITEDPSNRRKNGGGRTRTVIYVVPMSWPQVVSTPNGPAVTHSTDFALVTASKPAAAGEILSLFVAGLGPTQPGVEPGQPFPLSPPAAVNSPVDVKVNGKSAEVLAAVGFPGAVDGYQVNFRVPADTAKGAATVQVSAAWTAGPSVNVLIQ